MQRQLEVYQIEHLTVSPLPPIQSFITYLDRFTQVYKEGQSFLALETYLNYRKMKPELEYKVLPMHPLVNTSRKRPPCQRGSFRKSKLRLLGWAPCVMQQLLTSYLFYKVYSYQEACLSVIETIFLQQAHSLL